MILLYEVKVSFNRSKKKEIVDLQRHRLQSHFVRLLNWNAQSSHSSFRRRRCDSAKYYIFITISRMWSKSINITSKLCGSFTLAHLCRQKLLFEIQNRKQKPSSLNNLKARTKKSSRCVGINKNIGTDKIGIYIWPRWSGFYSENIKYGYFGIEIWICSFHSFTQIVSDCRKNSIYNAYRKIKTHHQYET